jgi:hypothetical protein
VNTVVLYCADRTVGWFDCTLSNTTLLAFPLISIMPSAPWLNARKI